MATVAASGDTFEVKLDPKQFPHRPGTIVDELAAHQLQLGPLSGLTQDEATSRVAKINARSANLLRAGGRPKY